MLMGGENPLSSLLVLTSASFSPAGLLLTDPPHPLAREQLPKAETVAEKGAPHPGRCDGYLIPHTTAHSPS